MVDTEIPTYRDLMLPTLVAIRELGGSGAISEVDEKAIAAAGVTEQQLAVEYPPEASSSGSKVVHRLHWARTYLKAIGALDNSVRGVWSLTPRAHDFLAMPIEEADHALKQADNAVRAKWRKARQDRAAASDDEVEDDADDEPSWKEQLLQKLKAMPPESFERLAMRLLREAGFTNVQVTSSGADGGIDGVGVYKPSLVSFPTYFQCKRWKGSVGAGVIRDFRGAMTGRGEKGLVITTGTFTPSAKTEATRDGAPPVDLIGDDELCNLLRQYGLGVEVKERVVEDVTIDEDFFDSV